MRHHVQPLRCSQRDNVIVWASLWPRLKRVQFNSALSNFLSTSAKWMVTGE
jgi:hypothetical protein